MKESRTNLWDRQPMIRGPIFAKTMKVWEGSSGLSLLKVVAVDVFLRRKEKKGWMMRKEWVELGRKAMKKKEQR